MSHQCHKFTYMISDLEIMQNLKYFVICLKDIQNTCILFISFFNLDPIASVQFQIGN